MSRDRLLRAGAFLDKHLFDPIQPEDIAAAVGFLASPGAAYVTGTTVHVNGGMFMN